MCKTDLPYDAGLVDSETIAIIGGRATGKGTYFASLYQRLQGDIAADFDMLFRPVGDKAQQRLINNYIDPIFRRHTVLASTDSAQVNSETTEPMPFRLSRSSGNSLRALNLVFFDAAGEDMESLDVMSREYRYITTAAAVIFLLDPLQIPQVRQKLQGAPLPPEIFTADPGFIVDRLRELYERAGLVRPEQPVSIPVAFTLTKIDALYPLLGRDSLLRRPGEHFGSFNDDDASSVHEEVWGYLRTWLGGGFTTRAEHGFSQGHYFAVSALGCNPGPDGRIETVSPIRVEDPLLWILRRMKIIPGTN